MSGNLLKADLPLHCRELAKMGPDPTVPSHSHREKTAVTFDHELPRGRTDGQNAASVLAGADHWTFIPPCSPELAKNNPMICADSPGISRAALHAKIQEDALSFFRATLHVVPE